MGIEYEDVADTAAQLKEDGIELTTRNVQAIPERARPPIFVGTHTHLCRPEVNILMGRGAGVPGGLVRSINPHLRCSQARTVGILTLIWSTMFMDGQTPDARRGGVG